MCTKNGPNRCFLLYVSFFRTIYPPPPPGSNCTTTIETRETRLYRFWVDTTVAPPLCDIPSGCCSFTGPWTVTRSSLRMLRRVATFCRPLRPVLLLVSFPRSRSPVVGVLGLCWMRHGVPFACQRRPIIGVLRMCWLLPGSFDCFCCPHTSVHRPSIACLAVFLCGPGAFLHALSGPSTICPFPPHGWSAPDGLPLLLRKQPIWAAGDTPHLMPVEQGLPWHPVATGLVCYPAPESPDRGLRTYRWAGGGAGGGSQVNFAVVKFAAGNSAEAPGFYVANFAETPRNVVVCRAFADSAELSHLCQFRGRPQIWCGKLICNAKFPT